eukprot:gene7714-5413_t
MLKLAILLHNSLSKKDIFVSAPFLTLTHYEGSEKLIILSMILYYRIINAIKKDIYTICLLLI